MEKLKNISISNKVLLELLGKYSGYELNDNYKISELNVNIKKEYIEFKLENK